MMLIAIVYLACAAFVLIHLARAPLVDDDGPPKDGTESALEPPQAPQGDEPPRPPKTSSKTWPRNDTLPFRRLGPWRGTRRLRRRVPRLPLFRRRA